MRALWSAGWAVGAVAYFAAGGDSSPIMLGIMVASVLLGFVFGSLRRWHQPVLGAWAASAAVSLLAVIAWIEALDALLQLSTVAAVVASLGYVAGAPPKEPVAPTRPLRILTPALRGLALAVLALGTGVTASMHLGWALSVAALFTIGWAALMTRVPPPRPARHAHGVSPTELLQGVLISAGLGSWLLLSLLIVPQLRFEIPWSPVNEAAVPTGAVLGLGMLGVGLGYAAAVPLVERALRPTAAWVLGPAAIGMLMLMVARPGALLWLGVGGVLLVSMTVAAGFRASTAVAPQLAADETVFARTATPAVLAAAAVGALASGMLAAVAEDRDVLLLPVVAVALAACWIDLRRAVSRRA